MEFKGSLSSVHTLKGKLQGSQTLSGTLTQTSILVGNLISTEGTLAGQLISQDYSLKGSITLPTIIPSGDVYDGPYHVTPLAHSSQTLETRGLQMLGDIVVSKIPYWETSNPSEGYTVYIAEA